MGTLPREPGVFCPQCRSFTLRDLTPPPPESLAEGYGTAYCPNPDCEVRVFTFRRRDSRTYVVAR